MRKLLTSLILAVFLVCGLAYFDPFILYADTRVYFSPKGGCTKAVVDSIDQAKQSILVQAYSFTSQPIAEALVNAYKRGVNVEIILDRSQKRGKGGKIDFVAQEGIPVTIDAAHAIAHNKVMIIDGKTVLTGSFNFTNAAEEHNAENLLIFDDAALASLYTNNWNIHQKHSKRYDIHESLRQVQSRH